LPWTNAVAVFGPFFRLKKVLYHRLQEVPAGAFRRLDQQARHRAPPRRPSGGRSRDQDEGGESGSLQAHDGRENEAQGGEEEDQVRIIFWDNCVWGNVSLHWQI
jgi:hypothetical protein